MSKFYRGKLTGVLILLSLVNLLKAITKILLDLYLRIKILIDSLNYESAFILLEEEKDFRINNFDMSFLSADYIEVVCSAMDLREMMLDKLLS